MLNRYYEQELGYLRTLAAAFAASNPALAPLLGAGSASDRDVERLRGGVAFMRSEEGRGGKEGVRRRRFGWSASNKQTKYAIPTIDRQDIRDIGTHLHDNL